MKVALFLLAAALSWPLSAAEALPELGDPSQTVLSLQQERLLGESIMRQIRASQGVRRRSRARRLHQRAGLQAGCCQPQRGTELRVLSHRRSGHQRVRPARRLCRCVHRVDRVVGERIRARRRAGARNRPRHPAPHCAPVSKAAAGRNGVAGRDGAGAAGGALESRTWRALPWPVRSTRTVQTQLNFTRDNEREADRIGVQTLEKAGFDPRAMPLFLERMQRAYRVYDDTAPSYARTHPLTYERIADVESRVDALPYRQVPDSLAYRLVKARLQVQQFPPRDAVAHFEDVLNEKKTVSEPAARYGLVLALLRVKDFQRANREADVLAGGGAGQRNGGGPGRAREGRGRRSSGSAAAVRGRRAALSIAACADYRLRTGSPRRQASEGGPRGGR